MNGLDSTLRNWAMMAATQPLSRPVPGETASQYLDNVGYRKPGRRTAWRSCLLRLSGQRSFQRDRFPPGVMRLLWIYFGEDGIGDALMDLAARSLLSEFGFEVDLYTSASFATLFKGDPWFRRVGSDAADFQGSLYDCAIVLSNKARPLAPKQQSFPTLQWVSLHGFFTGPNFHRGLFVAQRLADLAGIKLCEAELLRHGRQKLIPLPHVTMVERKLQRLITIAVGGAHQDRTYTRWHEVLCRLIAKGYKRFALVGSANGNGQAASLTQSLSGAAQIIDFTGRLTLAQTRAILDASSVVACPDGGLMHLALTTAASIVPLFSAEIAPEWRLPYRNTETALSSATDQVSDIAPDKVADMISLLLQTEDL